MSDLAIFWLYWIYWSRLAHTHQTKPVMYAPGVCGGGAGEGAGGRLGSGGGCDGTTGAGGGTGVADGVGGRA